MLLVEEREPTSRGTNQIAQQLIYRICPYNNVEIFLYYCANILVKRLQSSLSIFVTPQNSSTLLTIFASDTVHG